MKAMVSALVLPALLGNGQLLAETQEGASRLELERLGRESSLQLQQIQRELEPSATPEVARDRAVLKLQESQALRALQRQQNHERLSETPRQRGETTTLPHLSGYERFRQQQQNQLYRFRIQRQIRSSYR
ncbi:MAG: hypothetical protein KDI63_12675 [Gammaproteobacteria bacterium]|nr:hypothetical protein [Gammaproteobacteria bacterium]